MKKINTLSVAAALLFALNMSAQQVTLKTPDMTVQQGEIFQVDVEVEDFSDVVAMAMAVKWNKNVLKFKGIVNLGLPNMTVDGNFNTLEAANGKIRLVWEDVTFEGATLPDNGSLFSIKFEAIGSPGSNSLLQIDGDTIFPPLILEVNTLSGTLDLNVMSGIITIDGTNAASEIVTQDFTLFQNSPNPFSDMTVISFNMKETSVAILTIYDNAGKLVYRQNRLFFTGLNNIPVERSLFQSAGTYTFSLQTAHAAATRQLIAQ